MCYMSPSQTSCKLAKSHTHKINFNPDKSRGFRERVHTARAIRNKFNSVGLLGILA